MTLEQIIANLPSNMQAFDKAEYFDTKKRIAEIEASEMNQHMLEPLRNYAFRLITPYVVNPNYNPLNS